MRYNPNRSYFHPVLRPHSDDYDGLDGTDGAVVEWKRIASDYHFSVQFTIAVPAVRQAIEDGGASCLAVVYCPSTLHRQAITDHSTSLFVLEGRTPRSHITGQVEVYPTVVANHDIELDTDDAHEDYGKRPIEVRKGAPLATFYPWVCDAPEETRSVESIVVLDFDESLDDGEFEVETEPSESYVVVKTNRKTRGDWDAVGPATRLSTVYMAAITQALTEIRLLGDSDDSETLWVACLRKQLRIQNIGLPARDDDGESNGEGRTIVSPTRAAQLLLRKPMALALLQDEDDDEE